MRMLIGFAAMALAGAVPARAAPNVFWTFGFDLPRHGDRTPHFGEIAKDARYADAALQKLVPIQTSVSALVFIAAVQDINTIPARRTSSAGR